MSPSWRDRVEVFLAPQGIELRRIPRGLRSRPTLRHAEPCAPGGAHDGVAAAQAAARALAARGWQDADVAVTLSNHFVHLALVPGFADTADAAERLELARHRLRLVYGPRADGWTVALAGGRAAAPIAAATDDALARAVRDSFGAAGARLRALRPFFAEAYDRARAFLPRAAAWFAAVEPGRVCVAYLDGARWAALRCERAPGEPRAALALALDRCRLAEAIDGDPAEAYVVARDGWPEGEPVAGRWRLRLVPDPEAVVRAA